MHRPLNPYLPKPPPHSAVALLTPSASLHSLTALKPPPLTLTTPQPIPSSSSSASAGSNPSLFLPPTTTPHHSLLLPSTTQESLQPSDLVSVDLFDAPLTSTSVPTTTHTTHTPSSSHRPNQAQSSVRSKRKAALEQDEEWTQEIEAEVEAAEIASVPKQPSSSQPKAAVARKRHTQSLSLKATTASAASVSASASAAHSTIKAQRHISPSSSFADASSQSSLQCVLSLAAVCSRAQCAAELMSGCEDVSTLPPAQPPDWNALLLSAAAAMEQQHHNTASQAWNTAVNNALSSSSSSSASSASSALAESESESTAQAQAQALRIACAQYDEALQYLRAALRQELWRTSQLQAHGTEWALDVLDAQDRAHFTNSSSSSAAAAAHQMEDAEYV